MTLAPDVEREHVDRRRDTVIYSAGELSTAADCQRSREYRPSYRSDFGDREAYVGGRGLLSDLDGRQPVQGEMWPATAADGHRGSLTPGHATSSADYVIVLLWNRFGSINQAERRRAELRALRRRRNDSLQFIYQEVRRLMALAFPGQGRTLWEVMARDAFLDGLGDQSITVRVSRKIRRRWTSR